MVNIDDKINWIEFYSGRLPTTPKPAGDHKYNACCPFHDERNPSFWFNTTNGMWKCESGCGSGNATSFLAKLENIDTQEAYKQLLKLAGVENGERQKLPETLEHYAKSKHMPEDYLESLGLKDREGDATHPAYVAIPYYGPDGKCVAIKQRYNPLNKQRFGWDKGGKPTLYGLWLDMNKAAASVILCEGESDAQSCWKMGLPCYGVPGATNFQKEWTEYIGDRNIYIHVEPDRGGQQFLIKTLTKLKEAGFAGKVFSFRCCAIDGESKDPSEVLIRYGDQFRNKIDPVIKAAKAEDLDNIPVIHEAKDTTQKKEVKPLEVYRASDLYGMHIEAPPTIIRGLIPAGLSVLAGAPKRGKSWMALEMGISVASGQPFMGMETEIGDVLYLDLEGKKFRVQKRLEKLLVGPAPDRLFISHECERLDDGLMDQVNMWAAEAEHPVMVIIDTLGKVDGARKKGENAYQSDTRVLGTLQGFALDKKIAVVVVHHLRKSTAGSNTADPFELVSGSMGITGVADAVLLLTGKRGEEDSLLSVSSRDFEAKELVIMMDNGRWILKSTNSEEYLEEQRYLKSPYIRAIVQIAHRYHYWKGTSSELTTALIEAGCAEAGQNDIRKIIAEIVNSFQKKLYEREGVVFDPPRKGAKGKRYIEIREVQKDGF